MPWAVESPSTTQSGPAPSRASAFASSHSLGVHGDLGVHPPHPGEDGSDEPPEGACRGQAANLPTAGGAGWGSQTDPREARASRLAVRARNTAEREKGQNLRAPVPLLRSRTVTEGVGPTGRLTRGGSALSAVGPTGRPRR